jgi:hypothetical protein
MALGQAQFAIVEMLEIAVFCHEYLQSEDMLFHRTRRFTASLARAAFS